MDEMKVKLTTKFMRGIVSKLISKAIYSKCGYKVDVQLNGLDIGIVDGETSVNANVELKLSRDEFMKLVNSIGMD